MSNKKKLAHFVGDPICERLLTQKTSLCQQEKPMRFFRKKQNAFSDSHIFRKGERAQHKKRGWRLTILPVNSSPHLPNNERSSVPGASSSLSLDNSRLCKINGEYEICKFTIQRRPTYAHIYWAFALCYVPPRIGSDCFQSSP